MRNCVDVWIKNFDVHDCQQLGEEREALTLGIQLSAVQDIILTSLGI